MEKQIWISDNVRGEAGRLIMSDISSWKLVDHSLARQTHEQGAPWPNSKIFSRRINSWRMGRKTRLTKTDQEFVRLGVGVGLMVSSDNRQPNPVFLQFDKSHPTRPLHLTPPAGLFDQDSKSPKEGALKELYEEVIIVRGDCVGYWLYQGQILGEDYVNRFAKKHNLKPSGPKVLVEDYQLPQDGIELVFGETSDQVSVAFEPDTGSIEVIYFMKAILPKNTILMDGERLPSGRPAHRIVIETGPLTSKASAVISAIGRQ